MILAPYCPPHRDTNTAVPDVLYELAVVCRESVKRFAPDAEFVDTSITRYDYWNAVSLRWNTGEDLIIIEHDIEITAETVSSLLNCSQDWCSFQYESRVGRGDYWKNALGCTKFSAFFQSKVNLGEPDDTQSQWVNLGNWIVDCQRAAGYQEAHVHGTVKHHHHPLGPGM